jgi:hypothetical protein
MTRRTGDDSPSFVLYDHILKVRHTIWKEICRDRAPRHRSWATTTCDQRARDELAHLAAVKVLSQAAATKNGRIMINVAHEARTH